MVIAYHPGRPLDGLASRVVLRTLLHPMYLGTLGVFLLIRIGVAIIMTADTAKQLDVVFTYPATLIGTLFSLLIGFFVNNCYTRFMDNWRAAMIGWSRLNDLALQVYGYVQDRTQACEVLRLMNAANHLCYGDLAGQNMINVCLRRHLLTEAEAEKLKKVGGPPPFYIVSCWALEKLADQSKEKPVEKMYVLAMDKSVIEWRQQTTLLPMIQMNPIPFPYYRNMVLLLIIFEVVVAFKIALGGFTPLGLDAKVMEIVLDFVLFAAISLLSLSLFLTSTYLLMPWQTAYHGKKALRPSREDFGRKRSLTESLVRTATKAVKQPTEETTDMPAEYFILLPLLGHRRLFEDFATPDTPPASRSESIFLKPLHDIDAALVTHFVQTDSWRMMKILHESFRNLAPSPRDLPYVPPDERA